MEDLLQLPTGGGGTGGGQGFVLLMDNCVP